MEIKQEMAVLFSRINITMSFKKKPKSRYKNPQIFLNLKVRSLTSENS